MNKNIILGVIILLVAIAAFLIFGNKKNSNPNPSPSENQTPAETANKPSPLNANYLVETQIITFQNGKAEGVAPYGADKQTTEIVGEPAKGDLNSDGQEDYAVVIKQQTANDVGVYYYVAIALVDEAKKMIAGSNAVPLGEGVKIEDISIVNQAVRINFLERKIDGDNVAKEATIPVSKSYILDGVMFKELTPKRANAQAEAACTDNRGEWNKDDNACKGISKELCDKFGGKTEGSLCKF